MASRLAGKHIAILATDGFEEAELFEPLQALRSEGAVVEVGGAHNPDQLRVNELALRFIRAFSDAGKPMGVICHAPWLLINAGLAEGKKLTSWPTIRQDLKNAGATVLDQEVVVDGRLVTSRGPKDLPAFCRTIIEMFEGASRD